MLQDINIELLKSNAEISSFLKLERRTSFIYKELLSRGIVASSAYKLPESLNKIYTKSVSTFNLKMNQEKEISFNIEENISNNLISNNTPSPLKKKQHIMDVLSHLKLSFTRKIKNEMESIIDEEDELDNDDKAVRKLDFFNFNNNISDFNLQNKKTFKNNLSFEILKENTPTLFNRPSMEMNLITNRVPHSELYNDELNSNNRLVNVISNSFDNKYDNNLTNITHSPYQFINDFKNEQFCRICKEDHNAEENKLITPCECEGLIKFTHTQCILQFVKDFKVFENEEKICEICNSKYKFEVRNYKKCKFLIRKNCKKTFSFFTFVFIMINLLFYSIFNYTIDSKNSFIEILFCFASLFFIISLIYVFKDILEFQYYEEWKIENNHCKIIKKKIGINKNSKSHSPIIYKTRKNTSSWEDLKINVKNFMSGVIKKNEYNKIDEKKNYNIGIFNDEVSFNKNGNKLENETTPINEQNTIKKWNKFEIKSPLNFLKTGSNDKLINIISERINTTPNEKVKRNSYLNPEEIIIDIDKSLFEQKNRKIKFKSNLYK